MKEFNAYEEQMKGKRQVRAIHELGSDDSEGKGGIQPGRDECGTVVYLLTLQAVDAPGNIARWAV